MSSGRATETVASEGGSSDLWTRYRRARSDLEEGRLEAGRQGLEELLSEETPAPLRAEALNALAVARHGLGDPQGAVQALEASESLQSEIGDSAAWGRVLLNLGTVYLAEGRADKAESAFRSALARLEDAGLDGKVVAEAWRGLGRAQLALGGMVHERRAVESHGRSYEIFEAEGDRSEMAASLVLMGHAFLARYKWSEALGSFRQALALWEVAGDRRGMAVASNGLGQTFYEKEEYDRAREHFEQDLAHAEAAKDAAGVARAWSDLGRAHAALGSWSQAEEAYGRALAIRKRLGDRRGVALVRWARAHMAFSQGDGEVAVSEMEEAVAILRELGGRDLARAQRHLARMRSERPGPWRRYL